MIVEGKVPFDIIRYVYSAAALWHSDFHPPRRTRFSPSFRFPAVTYLSVATRLNSWSSLGGHVPGRPAEVTHRHVRLRGMGSLGGYIFIRSFSLHSYCACACVLALASEFVCVSRVSRCSSKSRLGFAFSLCGKQHAQHEHDGPRRGHVKQQRR